MKADSGAGEVTIDGEGAETINGFSAVYLNQQYQKVQLICDGSGWIKLDGEPCYISGHMAMGGGYYIIPILENTNTWDYQQSNMVYGTWYSMDLSSRVPSGTKAIDVQIDSNNGGDVDDGGILLYRPYNSGISYLTNLKTRVLGYASQIGTIGFVKQEHFTVLEAPDGKCDFTKYNNTYNALNVSVHLRGYYMGF
jgi:hypothetical protein